MAACIYAFVMHFIPLSSQESQRVFALAQRIWTEHYTELIGPEQVAYMLDTVHSAAAIAEQIDQGMHYELVQIDDRDCAYVAFIAENDHCFLSKLYVDADYRGRGIGSAAIERVRQFAIEKQLPCIRLGVNKGNDASIAMYQARGFQMKEDISIDIGGGFVMDDHLMQLDL